MSSRRDSLNPPVRTHTEDPGARDLDSDSDDHFSDAHSVPAESMRGSPIPRTRVEKVSDEPSYGEVPGTEAYRLREGDAEPDEIAIVPEKEKYKSEGAVTAPSPAARPTTPGGKPIPTTVLEEAADGEGAKTPERKKHESDPLPDFVLKADSAVEGGSNVFDPISPDDDPNRPSSGPSSPVPRNSGIAAEAAAPEDAGGAEDFGDDFDDFEEGVDDDDDFGDFDDGFQESSPPAAAPSQPPSQSQAAAPPSLSFPIPDFEGLEAGDILHTAAPYLNGLYQPDDENVQPPPALSNTTFLTPRSASLWSQLVAPPPLQPPDWIRSRIRRLFLVSLGVPVDLDEILPASKQKKLVLPSLSVHRDSPRTSTDSRGNGSGTPGNSNVARLKQAGANNSSTSVDSQGRPKESSGSGAAPRKRKGPPPPPDLDLVAGRQLCTTTDEALDGMTDDELRAHARKLQALEVTAKEVLEYWTKRTDEKIGDREAFEGVIENLVKHARKTRK